MERDKQKQAVYDWEKTNIALHDTTKVPFDQIEKLVKFIWTMEGYEYPPQVIPLPKQCSKAAGDATRTTIRFKETTYTWIVIHEVAHSLTSNADGTSNHHGALFMGLYCQLAARYLRLSFDELATSAEQAGLKVKRNARPVWIEEINENQ
jgi:hypothetical protein